MASVVLELQRDALDSAVRVSDLLRKALVVARKLSLNEFQSWIEKELSDYGRTDAIPEYREVRGEFRAWNPYRGWVPLIVEDARAADQFARRKCSQSIAEIEALLRRESRRGQLHMPFSGEALQRLRRGMEFDTQVSLFTQHAALARIVDAVRTVVLNWSLKLEENGIAGEGLSFTAKEKQQAAGSPQNVTNFYGPVLSSQVQQGVEHAVQMSATAEFDIERLRGVLSELRCQVGRLNLEKEAAEELQAEVECVEAQVRSPKPKWSIIRQGLESARRILEGAAGGAAGQLIVELSKVLGGR